MTIFRIFVPLCALLTLLSSSAAMVFASTPNPLHSSAIETRVEQRRQERMQQLRHIELHPAEKQVLSIIERVQQRLTARRLLQERAQLRAEARRQELQQNAVMPLEQVKTQVIEGTNIERALMGIPPVTYNRLLEQSAQGHAQDMLQRDYFSHETPEGVSSSERIKETGYGVINAQECRCSYSVALGENIAKGQQTVEEVVEAWMNSPSHREAMLSQNYEEVGVGIAGDLWVLNFGSVRMEPVGSK